MSNFLRSVKRLSNGNDDIYYSLMEHILNLKHTHD